MNLAVSMQGISKRYGSVNALDNVSLEVEKGTIHAVVGENGAGKTTLMKALYGAMTPDTGTISVLDQVTNFNTSKDAIAVGVGMVSQHYGIIGELSNLENLVLGAEDGLILNKSQLVSEAQKLAESMNFEFDWNTPSDTLSPAGGQKLEILKLLWRKAKIMILDEPTAMLSPQDADSLFASLRKLVTEGTTVIIVTHRLQEVYDYCKRVTVLRAGKKVSDHMVTEVSAEQLAKEIVGGEVIERAVPTANIGEIKFTIQNLTVNNSIGLPAVLDANLEVRAGQMIGIAGVDGNGQRELFHAIVGVSKPSSGSIKFEQSNWDSKSTSERLINGLRVIPEDRQAEGIIEQWSITENSVLGLQRLPGYKKLADAMFKLADPMAKRFSTKLGSLSDPISSLSGGNQQRFVAGRALEITPGLILAFQPARGLDLNATTRVYQGIRKACDEGAAAIIVSFDLDELLDFCDEIVVMNHGRLSLPPLGKGRDRDEIGKLMVGAE
jgi:simple sugar transport system ATP-binding protein